MTAAVAREFEFTRRDFDYLRGLANRHTGIVVGDDKFDMFYSRLARRLRALGLRRFADYCQWLEGPRGEEELPELVNAITTNLTAFFRENHHFEFLARTALPEAVERNAAERRVRVWSAGCSTGEEPYSISMVVAEQQAERPGWQAEIFATDIDSNVLADASLGVYDQRRVEGLPRERLRRWFLKGRGAQAGRVRVRPEVRRPIRFSQLNLMEEWSMPVMDMIFCRNVIIYFDKESKVHLAERFANHLVEGGYLFIGHSESLYKVSDRFELVGNTVYRKIR